MRTALIASLALPTMFGFDAEAPASGGTPAADPNVMLFPISGTAPEGGTDVQMSIELQQIPAEARLSLLKNAARAYVQNSVNQAQMRHKKALEPWAAYDAATAADALQTAVPKPEGERPTIDLIATATAARERLYKGEMRKTGERKERTKVDPVEKAITDAVLREVFEKGKAANSDYKWPDAVKEVTGGGRAYLERKIAERVAAGGNEAELRKVLEERYIKPAELMYGKRTTKATEGGIL